jgi:enterochelin esterase-like enzyme
MRLCVYLPPHYRESGPRCPVVYLLHPWGPDERFWADALHFHEVADHLIEAGAIPPFVAVMPQGDKSYFINAADPGGDFSPILRLDPDTFEGALDGYGDYGDYVLQDVLPTAERTYQVRADQAGRVIAGIGMGATGAAALAFQHPDVFGAVGIHSPALEIRHSGPPWIFGLGDPEALAERHPASLAARLPRRSGLRIYLDGGYDDDDAEAVIELHHTLIERGVQHNYAASPGESDADTWAARLPEWIGFYAAGW